MKILPVAVGSRPAIVLIVAYHLDFRVLGQIVVQYGVLASDLSRGLFLSVTKYAHPIG